MSIRHAILGLLREQPMHGYKLKAAFDARVSPLWGLTTGQIYQSLAALTRAGYLDSRSERSGRRPKRRIYSVTDAGNRELNAWLVATPPAWERPFREDVLIRLMLLRDSEAPALRESLARQEREALLLLTRVTHMRDGRHADQPGINLLGIFVDGMTHHLEADLKHLQSCRRAIETWCDARGLTARTRPGIPPLAGCETSTAAPPLDVASREPTAERRLAKLTSRAAAPSRRLPQETNAAGS